MGTPLVGDLRPEPARPGPVAVSPSSAPRLGRSGALGVWCPEMNACAVRRVIAPILRKVS